MVVRASSQVETSGIIPEAPRLKGPRAFILSTIYIRSINLIKPMDSDLEPTAIIKGREKMFKYNIKEFGLYTILM